jgi:hypothetical protein
MKKNKKSLPPKHKKKNSEKLSENQAWLDAYNNDRALTPWN